MVATGDEALVKAVLADWRTAPVSEKVRAMFGFLERVTVSPKEVTPDDIAPLRAAGISDKGIEEALYVCFLFNMIDRLADTFGFQLPDAEGFRRSGQSLFQRGYGMSSIPG